MSLNVGGHICVCKGRLLPQTKGSFLAIKYCAVKGEVGECILVPNVAIVEQFRSVFWVYLINSSSVHIDQLVRSYRYWVADQVHVDAIAERTLCVVGDRHFFLFLDSKGP